MKRTAFSRQSSGDEGLPQGAMGPTYHKLDYSDIAVFSGGR
jgi:hypothetical protein